MALRTTLLLAGSLLAGALLCTATYAEERIAIELGRGSHWLKDSDALFVRYIEDEAKFPAVNIPARYEVSFGAWEGRHRNTAVGLAFGPQYNLDRFYINGTGGVALLSRKTRVSGTRQQFILRVGGGYRFDKFDIGVYQTHYSNFDLIFDWDGPNSGYDVLTVQVNFPLK